MPSHLEVAPHPSTVDATQKRRRFKNTKETEKKIHKGRIVRRRTSGGHRPSPLNMNHVHPFTHTRSHFVCHGLPLSDWLYSNEQWSPIGPHVVLKWFPIGPHVVLKWSPIGPHAYLIFVTSISSGASVILFDWGEFFHSERETDSWQKYPVWFYTQCVILYTVCDFTHSV